MKVLKTKLKNRRMFVCKDDMGGGYRVLTKRLFDPGDWDADTATCQMKKAVHGDRLVISTHFCLSAEAIEALYESYVRLNGGVAAWTVTVKEKDDEHPV